MSYENIPKNLTEQAVLTRQGRPDYITTSTGTTPVPTADEAGAIWEHSDTGDRFRWTSTVWVEESAAPKNWAFEVAAGRIDGVSAITITGRNPSLANSDDFEAIWELGGDYTGFNASAEEVLSIVSASVLDTSAGTGARTLLLSGLDISYNEQSEIITLNGTTPVLSTLSYLRVNKLLVLTAGSLGSNADQITVTQSTTTANVMAAILEGNNISMAAAYTVPAGKIAYLSAAFIAASSSKTTFSDVQFKLRLPNALFFPFAWLTVDSQGSSFITKPFIVPRVAWQAGSDILALANSTSAGAGISAGWDIILEDV